MNWPKLKSQFGRTVVVLGLAGGMLGGFGAAAAQAAVGSEPGDLNLSETTGSVNDQPTWSTTVGCKTGFTGSAILKIIEPDGTTFSISPAVPSVTAAFSGTLQDTISNITQLPPGIAPGTTAELVVFCFSQPSEQGTADPEMSTFLTISADGTTFSTSSTQSVPVGEIGGLVFAGLAAVGLVYLQVRRRSSRRAQAAA